MDESGSSLIECALILPLFVLLLAGAVDFGRAWYLNLEVSSSAEAGALYGVQNSADITGMNQAALLDAPDLSTLQANSTFGSECSDGTSVTQLTSSPSSCSVNSVGFLEVNTSAVSLF